MTWKPFTHSLLVILCAILFLPGARTEPAQGPKVIYGEDNRLDYYQVTDEILKELSESTVVLVDQSNMIPNGDGYDINCENTLASLDFCPDEPFLNQPTPGDCSGFLVAPDLIATASHCVDSITSMVVVFGFRMNGEDDMVSHFSQDDIYYPSMIIDGELGSDGSDWALIQLDREVVNREPLQFRTSGKIPDNQSVAAIGHPIGLPLKIAAGAYVRGNTNETFFITNTDTFGGNSGSAVVNLDTYVVEGILVRGDTDFVDDDELECNRSNVCPETGCRGEDCTRATQWSDVVLNYISPAETPTPSMTPTPSSTPTFIQTDSGYLDTDLNHDGVVNSNDLIQFIEDYGIIYPTPTPVTAR